MKASQHPHVVPILMWVITVLLAGSTMTWGESDAREVKKTLLLLSRDALGSKFATVAFQQIEETIDANNVVHLYESQVRLTIDVSTGRYVAEQVLPAREPSPTDGALRPSTYFYQRWDGKKTIAGSRSSAMDLELPPLGRPWVNSVRRYDGLIPCGFADSAKRAAGFSLFGKETLVAIGKTFRKASVKVELLTADDGTGVARTVNNFQRFDIDPTTGHLLNSAQTEAAPPSGQVAASTETVIERGKDGIPARATVTWVNASPEIKLVKTTYEKLTDGCRWLTQEDFESCISAELEPGTVVFDKSAR